MGTRRRKRKLDKFTDNRISFSLSNVYMLFEIFEYSVHDANQRKTITGDGEWINIFYAFIYSFHLFFHSWYCGTEFVWLEMRCQLLESDCHSCFFFLADDHEYFTTYTVLLRLHEMEPCFIVDNSKRVSMISFLEESSWFGFFRKTNSFKLPNFAHTDSPISNNSIS